MTDTATPTPPKPIPPPDRPGELVWIREALNKLDGKLDKLDERLRTVENKISTAKGWITAGFALLFLLQLVLKLFDVSITPK